MEWMGRQKTYGVFFNLYQKIRLGSDWGAAGGVHAGEFLIGPVSQARVELEH